MKTRYPVAVLPNGDETTCLSTTELVLSTPRFLNGQGFLSVSEDRIVGIYAAER